MASLNKVFLMGNLTRDPELRYLSNSGSAVCEFGLAVNRRFVSKGQDREETCFVDMVVWGKQAETCHRFLKKGSQALIEGRLQLDQWEDRETGKSRSKMRVVAERVQFLNSPGRGETEGYRDNRDQAPRPAQQASTQNQGWDGTPNENGPEETERERPAPTADAPNPAPPSAAENQAAGSTENSSEPFQVDDETEDDIPF